MKNGLKFIACLSMPLIIGAIAGIYTSKNIATWYVFLNKPTFNPPNYLFGPVWTTLYILMGVSFFIVLNKADEIDKKKLISIFAFQLLLNFMWSFIFFEFHLLGWALVEIIIMWLSILTMILIFYKTNKLAAIINIPYLLWVSFATFLNYNIYVLN